MGNTNQNEEKMKLMVNGMEATVGMEVTTFRGEPYILTDWRAPGEICGGSRGKVYCKTKEDYESDRPFSCEWYPSVIGGEFVKESELAEEEERKAAANDENMEEQVELPLRRKGR